MAGHWIILMGAPGCGKGTQVEYLVKDAGFSVISVGDLLRENRTKKVDENGTTIGEIISSGALLPDEIVLDLVRTELDGMDNPSEMNILFDGFPRTPNQAEALNKMASSFGGRINRVLNFVVDDEVITKRILGRYKCSKCGKIYNDFFLKPAKDGVCDVCGGTKFDRRADDNEESLKMRLKEYHGKTTDLIAFYQKMGVLTDIKADADFMTVKKSVLSSLDFD